MFQRSHLNLTENVHRKKLFLYLVDLKKTFSWYLVPWCRLFKTVLIQGKLPFFYFTCGRGFCAFLIHPWSCKKNANQKFFNTMSYFNQHTDLEFFPQMSQDRRTLLLMWFASTCVIMFARKPSFPQTLHSQAFCLWLFPITTTFSPVSIKDKTCSSSC